MQSKSCSYYRNSCPEHPNSCQDDYRQDHSLSSLTPTLDFMDRRHLDGEFLANSKKIILVQQRCAITGKGQWLMVKEVVSENIWFAIGCSL